jgi:hypothetical protein
MTEELNNEENKPEEPEIPKIPKKKRIYKRKKKEPDMDFNTNMELDEASMKKEFCNKIRTSLGINFKDETLMEVMKEGSDFLESHWDIMGKIVLPYVYGGMVIEGPQSTIKNAFVIGFFLGGLKEKYLSEIKDWKFGETYLKDMKLL